MRQNLGRIALGAAILGWLILLGGLFVGGLDPSPEEYNVLRGTIGFGLVAECLAVPFGFVAMILGPYRVAGVFALMLSGAYLLYFTGMIFMFFAARG